MRWKRAAILASGPSMTRDDAELVRGWRDGGHGNVIAVNTTFRLALWADILYASDRKWWEMHEAEVDRDFLGEKWTYENRFYGKAYQHARQVRIVRGKGLSKEPGVVVSGGNSGYTAMGLAYELGARVLILLGFDMQSTGGQVHWHGTHPSGLRQNPLYRGWLVRFPQFAADLEAAGVKVWNCTRETALTCFPRADLEKVLSAEQG